MNRANIQNIYPLLPNQEAFWSAHLHAATDPGCLQATYRLVGELDPDVLRQALQAVVENHPLLRSTIQSRPNKSAMMVVWKQASPSFEVHDFRHLSDEDKVSSVGAIKRRDTTEGLDLSKLTPHRFQLFQTEDHQFELTWTFHHIFIDGWSSAVVVRDVLERHDQILNAQTMKPSLVRYENFVAWRKTICSKTESRFWREQLDGYAGLAKRFPLAHAPGSTDRDSTKITRTLGARATNALGELAKTHGLTAGAIAAGLWTLTLSRFYGESDVAFGATVSGRSFPIDHAQDMVGLFSNVVPFRQRIEGSSSMASFLQSVRDKQFEIQAHEHASLAEVSSLRKLGRDRSLFDTLLVVENYPTYESTGRVQVVGFESGLSTSYPLTICALPTEDWTVDVVYDSQRVTAEVADSVLDYFVKALECLPQSLASTVDDFLMALPALQWVAQSGEPERNGVTCAATQKMPDVVKGTTGGPRDETELALTMIWERVLGISEVRYNDNFFEIGGRSLTATRIIAAIESEFSMGFTPAVLIEHPTVESLANLIRKADQKSSSSTLVRFNSVEKGNPLICVNVGVEPAMFYRHLASYFGDRPMVGTQSPGIHRQEKPFETVEEAAASFLREADELFYLDRDACAPCYDLVAYCAGCSVAFEMARQLEKAGRPVGSLTIVDSGLKYPRKARDLSDFRSTGNRFSDWFPRYIKYNLIKQTAPLRRIIGKLLARYGSSQEMRSRFRRWVVRAKTMDAYFKYEIGQINTPMMLIRSTEYVAIALKDFHENLRAYSATDQFRIEIIPAQHEQILFEPAVEDVARLVKSFSDVCNKGRGRDARLSDPLLRPSDEIVGTR